MSRSHTLISLRIAGALLLPLTLGPALHAQAPVDAQPAADEETYQGESPERYAQVRVLEGDVTIIKGEVQEALTRGTPVGEGDVVESRGRGVLQLGDGSRLAFGPGTRFLVAALFADAKNDRQILLRLEYGQIRIAVGSYSEAVVRVDTPAGSAVLAERAVASLEVEKDRSIRLKVHSGRARFSNEKDKSTIQAGERLAAYSPQDSLDRVSGFSTYDDDPFEIWCERSMAVRRGASWDHVPAGIRYYSEDLDDHGEWIEVEDAGWCWRPRVTEDEWRPYWRGRWGSYAGGMTWISDEPWGYITYHHGRWGWHARHGWYWIPGLYYSPAWVAWHHEADYLGWAPLGYLNAPVAWGFGAWGGGFCWNIINFSFFGAFDIHRHCHRDPHVIRGFNGHTTWTPGHGRDPRRPWLQGPLIVRPGEIRDPGRVIRAMDRSEAQSRLHAYSQSARQTTGREVVTRALPRPGEAGPRGRGVPFEDPRPQPGRPVVRDIIRSREPGLRPDLPGRVTREPGRVERPGLVPPRGWNEPRREPAPERPRGTRTDEPRPLESPRPRRNPDGPRGGFSIPAPSTRSEPSPRQDRPERPTRSERPSSPPPSRPSSPAPSSKPGSSGHDRGSSRRG